MDQWMKVIHSKTANSCDRFLHIHLFKSRSILIATTACWATIVLQIAVLPPATPVSRALICLDFALTLFLPLWTTQICVVLLALHSVCLLLPVNLTWASLLEFPALALLSYRCSPLFAAMIVILLTLLHISDGLIHAESNGLLWGAASFFPLCFTAFMIAALRRFKQSLERRDRLIAQERTQRLAHNKWLAAAIHDSITRELSAILLITEAWELNQEGDTNRAKQDMQNIGKEARVALNQMHRVIDKIDDIYDMDSRTTNGSDAVEVLRDLVGNEKQSASAAGFDGSIRFTEQPGSSIDAASLCLIEGFLEEVFANILRHAKPGEDSYSIDISISHDSAQIIQTNHVESEASRLVESKRLRHGRGLQAHRRAISAAGGTAEYDLHDGRWSLIARIPTTA